VINVPAIYENGVLRLTERVSLRDGQQVSVSIAPVVSPDEWERQIRAARTIGEWVALANACPDTDPDPYPGYDVIKAINETRRLTGFRMPDPEPDDEGPG
jgi:predicted DNA-binding antitoxin AbrB/MazE fold protein